VRQAAELYGSLRTDRPEAFLPELGGTLNNLSQRLSDLGRTEEALAAIEEAVGIFRTLASARPDIFLPQLAMSLTNDSNILSGLGRREEGLAAVEEALQGVLPLLEQAPFSLPDSGLRLGQMYIARCEETQRDPDPILVLRLRSVLVSAGLLQDEE